ncbi:uncharacterized protein L969DRAFT_18041 [Mixia osmundae IAM 14324]|uniref:uncharacterized protein n=1 Tax=Mixia osmundae (strain CBS 9802 / IAM 14324 / JCM 22182 / KY 12970) TaxID=764103 RepID=UPI0004A546C4|nr:uncharacterized protein L969DRAFT_18041 [Mixia osmundae IAM 14324]KEI38965.1 hypothetical protein L969DRAFT_18041 [Mixia osmundae IAM 14324]
MTFAAPVDAAAAPTSLAKRATYIYKCMLTADSGPIVAAFVFTMVFDNGTLVSTSTPEAGAYIGESDNGTQPETWYQVAYDNHHGNTFSLRMNLNTMGALDSFGFAGASTGHTGTAADVHFVCNGQTIRQT